MYQQQQQQQTHANVPRSPCQVTRSRRSSTTKIEQGVKLAREECPFVRANGASRPQISLAKATHVFGESECTHVCHEPASIAPNKREPRSHTRVLFGSFWWENASQRPTHLEQSKQADRAGSNALDRTTNGPPSNKLVDVDWGREGVGNFFFSCLSLSIHTIHSKEAPESHSSVRR